MRFDDQRQLMVERHLVSRGIVDSNVINAFLRVRRECFVDDEWKDFTYSDHPLSIGHEQTISQPYIVALMMSYLDLQKSDRVLEIGTGSGYQTALLAEIVSQVYTVERIEDLLMRAKATLKQQGYKNIHFKIGDGTLGWLNAVPLMSEFDKIIVCAGSPRKPENLLSQLAEGGKLVIPQGVATYQDLIVYEKRGGEVIEYVRDSCVFVPLIGKEGW